MQDNLALTVVQRAAVALGAAEHETKLIELAKSSTAIVSITNPDSYKECHSARVAIKNARVVIEKTGKAAREDATAFSKAVIAEEKRLIGIIAPEESRLQAIQDAHDAKVEAGRAEQARLKAERVERIQAAVAGIWDTVIDLAGKSSGAIAEQIKATEALVIDDSFAELKADAESVKSRALVKLGELHAAAVAHEAEQERIRAEREELARLRAEQADRTHEESARIAAEAKKRAAEEAEARRKIEEEQRASREKIEAEQRAARLEREKADRIARQQREAAEAIAKAKLDAEAEVARKAHAAEEARLKAERHKVDEERRALEENQRKERAAEEAKQREVERKANELRDADEMLVTFRKRFAHIEKYAVVITAIDDCIKPKEKRAA